MIHNYCSELTDSKDPGWAAGPRVLPSTGALRPGNCLLSPEPRRELGINIGGQPLQIKLQANLLKSRKKSIEAWKKRRIGRSDDVYETLCNAVASSLWLDGRPGSRRAALGRAGRDESQTRGPGRADNMRHSVARHPDTRDMGHRPLWTGRSETIVRRGASALLPVSRNSAAVTQDESLKHLKHLWMIM